MPNVRRFFPGGKQLAGKSFRPQGEEEDEEDDDSSSEDEEVAAPPDNNYSPAAAQQQQQQPRHQVMAARTGGKYLRPTEDDDDDDDDDDEESDEEPQKPTAAPVVMINRGGGKSLSNMRPPPPEPEDEEPPKPPAASAGPVVMVNRGGGKSLSNMRSPDSDEEEDSDDDDEEEDDDVQVVEAPHKIYRPQQGGGKQLRAAPRGGGKQLRMPDPAPAPVMTRAPAGGKQLRREPEVEEETTPAPLPTSILQYPPAAATVPPPVRPVVVEPPIVPSPVVAPAVAIARSPAGGKQLRPPVLDDEETPKPSTVAAAAAVEKPKAEQPQEQQVAPSVKTNAIVRSPSGGKQLQRPAGGKQLNRSGGGKQLRRDEFDSDDDEEESEEQSEDSDDEDFVDTDKKKKPKARPKRKAAARRKVVVEESEEEDTAMFDDDASSDEDEDDNDAEYLASLPEIEREKILAERYEKKKEKEDMKKAIQATKAQTTAAQQPPKKRKGAAAAVKETKQKKLKTEGDEDMAKALDGRRSSARSRDVSGTKGRQMKALAELKRQRKIQQDFVEESSDGSEIDFDDEEDSDEDFVEAKPWQASKDRKKPSNDGEGSDMDVDDDEDVKDDKDDAANAAMEAALADFQKITIPRRRLERWCNEPFFTEAVLNCFVRMFIGEDDQGEKQYRLCEIVDVTTGKKTYKFPRSETNATPVSTDKIIKVRFGTSEREFQMYLVSDAIPTESDVQKHISSQKSHKLEIITKRRAAQLRRMQDQLVGNYTYTTADIERNLKDRKMKGKVGVNLGSEQTRVTIALQGAKYAATEAEGRLALAKRVLLESSEVSSEQRNAVEEWTKKAEEAKKDLDECLKEQQALADVLSERKKKLSRRTKDQNWAKVNQRALELNIRADREGYRNQKEADARKAAGEKEKVDLFARRKVKPKILWAVGQVPDDKNGAEKGAEQANAGPSENTVAEIVSPAQISQITEVLAPLTVNNDFTIDEEGLANSSLETLGLRGKQPNRNRLRKGLSLAEYFERREKGTL